MKKIIVLLAGLLCFLNTIAQTDNNNQKEETLNTRKYTLQDLIVTDSLSAIFNSPLFGSFDGISVDEVSEIYISGRKSADSLITADSLNPVFWRTYVYQAANLVARSKNDPQSAMSVYLPLFLIIFSLIVVIWTIKTVFIRPDLFDVTKPVKEPN